MTEADFNLEPGTNLSHFKILRPLGQGGMGAVYLAEDLTLNREVAIKLMRRSVLESITDPTLRDKVEQRFIREAKSAAKLNHSHIAQVYEANFDDTNWYIVMEYIEGASLDEEIRNEISYDTHDAIQLIREVAEGLKYAWDKYKIIHRDIKPANIMHTHSEGYKIVDLGLAKPVAQKKETLDVTSVGQPIGTPYYMSPEQALGDELDMRSDMFSLGCAAYEVVTGFRAFPGHSSSEIYNMMVNRQYIPLAECRGGLPQLIVKVINKLLEPNAVDRYQSYDDLLNDIQHKSTQHHPINNSDNPSHLPQNISKENIGRVIAQHYRIVKALDDGHTGYLYQCINTKTKHGCSVKIIKKDHDVDLTKIEKNYRLLASLKHPHLLDIQEIINDADTNELYIIMNPITGKNFIRYTEELRRQVGSNNLFTSDFSEITLKISTGLESLGKQLDYLHCELKPISTFITDSKEVKFIDFELVHHIELVDSNQETIDDAKKVVPRPNKDLPIGVMVSTGKGSTPKDFLWPLYPRDTTVGSSPLCELTVPGKGIGIIHMILNFIKGSFFITRSHEDPDIYLSGHRVSGSHKQRISHETQMRFGHEEVKIYYFNTMKSITSEKDSLKYYIKNCTNPISARLMKITALNQRIIECETTAQIYQMAIDTVLHITGLDRGYGFAVKQKGEGLNVKEVLARTAGGETILEKDFTISRSVMTKVLESGGTAIIEDVDNTQEATVSLLNFKIKTVICLPLTRTTEQGEKELIGLIYADRTMSTSPLPPGIAKSMQSLCDLTAKNLVRCIQSENKIYTCNEYENYFETLQLEVDKIQQYLHNASVTIEQEPDTEPEVISNHLSECITALDNLVINLRRSS